MRDMTLENPIRAIREISHDLTGRRTVRLANGRELSRWRSRREYLERAARLRRAHAACSTTRRVHARVARPVGRAR